jgi:hypothetical protein
MLRPLYIVTWYILPSLEFLIICAMLSYNNYNLKDSKVEYDGDNMFSVFYPQYLVPKVPLQDLSKAIVVLFFKRLIVVQLHA